MDWISILSTLQQATQLSLKLYNTVKDNAENREMADELSKKIKQVQDNVIPFSTGSNATPVTATVAKILQDNTENVNKAIQSLLSKIQKKKIKSFMLASKLNPEVKRVLSSVTSLEYAYMNFAVQMQQSQMLQQLQVKNSELFQLVQGFLQVHNASSVHGTAKFEAGRGNALDGGYDAVEQKQVEAFSNIPFIIEQVKSAKISQRYKKELIGVLECAEKNWCIPYDDFSIDKVKDQRKLISAAGGFKNVYEGKLKTRTLQDGNDLPVAVLEYSLVRNDLVMCKGSLLREIYISWRLTHPCIVETYGAFWPSESEQGLTPMILCELMTHNLRNALKESALKGKITRYSIAVDVAEGLLHLHNNGIVHRDIKPENILLRIKDNVLVDRAKICDFGASREIRATSHQSTLPSSAENQLTPIYAPPEAFKGIRTTCEYDLWCFGLILCWLDGNPELQVSERPWIVPFLASNGKLFKMCKAWVGSIENEALRECAEKCTSEHPRERGSVTDVLSALKQVLGELHFNEGSDLYNEKKHIESTRSHERAVELFRTSAKLGNVDAMYRLGKCLLDGIGVEKNLLQATAMLKDAADRNHSMAQRVFNSLYKPELSIAKNDSEAFKYCKLAADLNVPEAQRLLGKLYESGRGVEKNYELALFYYQLAVDKEDGLAQFYLGELYHEGKGTLEDLTKAQRLYELSASQGIKEAIRKLKTEFNIVLRTLLTSPDLNITSKVLKGNSVEDVYSVALSSDGQMILSGGWDGKIRRWNAANGEPIGESLEGHKSAVTCVVMSNDNTMIVSASRDRTIRRWNSKTGKSIGEPLKGHTDDVTSIAISIDGSIIVSGSGDNTVWRWNARTGKAIGAPLKGHTDYVNSVAISRDGSFIVSGSEDKTNRRWDTNSGKQLGEPLAHHREVTSVAISTDMKMIVSGDGRHTIRRWEFETGRMLGEPLKGHTKDVNSVAISADGKMIVSGSWDNTIRRWNARTGEPIGEPLEHHSASSLGTGGAVTSVAISNDASMIVSGSLYGQVRMWTAAESNEM